MRRNLTTTANNASRQQPIESAKSAIGFRLLLAGVVPGSRTIHGHFQRGRVRISTRPRRLITVRMGVFFNRTLIRLSRIEVGIARRTRSDRERATATCEARTPRIFTSTFVVGPATPDKTPIFPTDDPRKHQQSQLSGSSDIAMQPQPFVHSQSHSPAPHFAILHPP
jgi:hypothetical protein